jgi:hypothetical protein
MTTANDAWAAGMEVSGFPSRVAFGMIAAERMAFYSIGKVNGTT